MKLEESEQLVSVIRKRDFIAAALCGFCFAILAMSSISMGTEMSV